MLRFFNVSLRFLGFPSPRKRLLKISCITQRTHANRIILAQPKCRSFLLSCGPPSFGLCTFILSILDLMSSGISMDQATELWSRRPFLSMIFILYLLLPHIFTRQSIIISLQRSLTPLLITWWPLLGSPISLFFFAFNFPIFSRAPPIISG